MINSFKKIAFLEGCSYLALFTNMLLIKRLSFELYHKILFPLGMAHGILFIAYIVLAFLLWKKINWDFKTFSIILIASLVPFGTFYIEKKYLQHAP